MEQMYNDTDATITFSSLPNGRNRVVVTPKRPDVYIAVADFETAYSRELIEEIYKEKGAAWLGDEVLREESPAQVQSNIEYGLLSFVEQKDFRGKTILDFGCGCGASTMILARMFPEARIVGVELLSSSLEVARARLAFYGYANVDFKLMPSPDRLPEGLGIFDFIVFSAVFEHLLPQERRTLFPAVYGLLKPGGIMFINELPYRYFPLEIHTTGGFPLINYLPDWAAYRIVRAFSRRCRGQSWEQLLRNGIRGGSKTEMKRLIRRADLPVPGFLSPRFMGVRDEIDQWYIMSKRRRDIPGLGLAASCLRLFERLTGLAMIHVLTLALRKPISKIV